MTGIAITEKRAIRMKKYAVSEEEFLEAIDEMARLEAAKLERIVAEAEAEENPHQFSEKFLEWKESFAQELDEAEKAKKAEEEHAAAEEAAVSRKIIFLHRFVNTPIKKAAAVAIVATSVLALSSGVQSEAGEFAVVKFFQERFSDRVKIEPHEKLREDQTKARTIENVYDLSWIPEGYEKIEEDVSEISAMQGYYNQNSDKEIKMAQYCVKAYFAIREEEGCQEIEYGGRKFYYLEREDEIIVVWYEDGYQFMINSDASFDETLKMAEGLEKR